MYIPRGIDDLTFPPSTDFVLEDGSYNIFEQKLQPLVSEYKSKELLRYVFLFGLCGTRFGKMERPEEMSASFTFDPFRFVSWFAETTLYRKIPQDFGQFLETLTLNRNPFFFRDDSWLFRNAVYQTTLVNSMYQTVCILRCGMSKTTFKDVWRKKTKIGVEL